MQPCLQSSHAVGCLAENFMKVGKWIFMSSQWANAAHLDIRQAKVEADGLRQQRQQRALLQLVVQDRGVAGAPASRADSSCCATRGHKATGAPQW